MAISLSLRVISLENPLWYNLYFGPRGGHSFPENERPFELPRQYRNVKKKKKREKEEGSRFFCAFTKVSLSLCRLATPLSTRLLWLFPCLAGEKKDSREMCLLARWMLCAGHADMPLSFWLVITSLPSSLSCSPRWIFFVSCITRKLIVFESTWNSFLVQIFIFKDNK